MKDPAIFVFGEFLVLENVKALGPQNKFLTTMKLFAYDTFMTYAKSPAKYAELNERQVKKLKLITLATLGQERRADLNKGGEQKSTLGYDELMRDLKIGDIRSLEDMIIDAIYAGLVVGKLD